MASDEKLEEDTHLASNARAHTPAAKGALAEVPVWSSVHPLRKSVVTCKVGRCYAAEPQISVGNIETFYHKFS